MLIELDARVYWTDGTITQEVAKAEIFEWLAGVAAKVVRILRSRCTAHFVEKLYFKLYANEAGQVKWAMVSGTFVFLGARHTLDEETCGYLDVGEKNLLYVANEVAISIHGFLAKIHQKGVIEISRYGKVLKKNKKAKSTGL